MIGVGEGGVVVSNNLNLFKKLESTSRNSPFRRKIVHIEKILLLGEGYNYCYLIFLPSISTQIENLTRRFYQKNFY